LARYLERRGDSLAANRAREEAGRLEAARADDHFQLGDEWYVRGDPRQARVHFEKALWEEPDHFRARYYLAVCCLRLQQWGEAKAHLSACLDRQRQFVWCYLLRGLASMELREFGPAAVDFTKAGKLLEQHPDSSAAYSLALYHALLQ